MESTTNETNIGSSPYDDVCQTMAVENCNLLIGVINEMYPEYHYDENAKIIPLNQTYFINKETSEQEKRIIDSAVVVISPDGTQRIFHIEWQSTTDGNMIFRIFEYDTQIALKTSSLINNDTLEVHMPSTGILYLRSNSSTPDNMTIKVVAPSGESLSYIVPIMKLKNYDCETILDKKLYFLCPFYLFNFEDVFAKIEAGDEVEIQSFRERFSKLYDQLKIRLEDGRIDAYTHHSIIMLTKKVIAALTQGKKTVKEEADRIMGGQVLDYETKVIFRQGQEKGHAQGVADRDTEKITEMLNNGKTPEAIADFCSYPLSQVQAVAKSLGLIN